MRSRLGQRRRFREPPKLPEVGTGFLPGSSRRSRVTLRAPTPSRGLSPTCMTVPIMDLPSHCNYGPGCAEARPAISPGGKTSAGSRGLLGTTGIYCYGGLPGGFTLQLAVVMQRQWACKLRHCGFQGVCEQCQHSSSWTVVQSYRIAPDSACFTGFPVFARPGMQFESHLGQDRSPRQRRSCV